MGAGSSGGPSLTPEEEALNQEKYAFQSDLLSKGTTLANRNFQSYNVGNRYADFDTQETAAQNKYLTYAGEEAGYYGDAMGAVRPNLGFSGTFQKQNLDPVTQAQMQQGVAMRMNPYTQQVIDATMGDYNRARQMTNTATAAQALGGGAFGGARHGVAESLTNEAFAREAGQAAAGLRYAGYGQALGGYEQERARLQAMRLQQEGMSADDAARAVGLNASQAALYATLGDLQDKDRLGRIGLQEQVGLRRRGMAQQDADFAYEQHMREQYDAYEKVNMMNAIASGNPYTPTPFEDYYNPQAGAAGGAMTGFATGASTGNPALAATGTILGAWAGSQQR